MSASTGPDLELTEKLLKILNLQADTALKEAQLRHQTANLASDTALKRAQLEHQPANLQADTALKTRQMQWEPWKAMATAAAAGGALVGGLIAAIAALMHARGNG